MSIARPFAYNPGSLIPGTEQLGDLSIGFPTSGFTDSPQYWNGPDEDLGYVIAAPVSGNTQPTPVTTNRVYLSPTYKGTDITLTNNGQTATQLFGYQQSVLGIDPIGTTDKVMFSVLCTLAAPEVLADSHFVGVGYTTMNYSGNPYGGFPGNDSQSLGYSSAGDIWLGGVNYGGGLQTWGNNDIIDIVIDNNTSRLWARVNGGNWNNNPSANPTTGSNGIVIIGGPFYPVLCPGYEGTMIIQNSPAYSIPSGYNFLATLASVGFYGTDGFLDSDFINVAEIVSIEYGTPQTFTNSSEASVWLTNNGFWNSFIPVTPTPTGTATNTPTQTPTQTVTPTNTETPTNTPTNTETPTPTNTETPTNTPTNTATVTPTNTETPTNTPTNTSTVTPTNTETPTTTPTNTQTPTPTPTVTSSQTPTTTPTNTQTPTPTVTQTPTSSGAAFVVTGGTGTIVPYTELTYLDAFSSQSGVTTTDAFNTNSGCWQLYYSHSAVTINSGSNNIGLNTYNNGTNTWTWYVTISNSNNTLGSWGTVSAVTNSQTFNYSAGGFNQSNITQTVTIPANRYFLVSNTGGPFYRTIKTLASNRTAQIGGSNYVTVCNKVALGINIGGGTTTVPTQFGGAGTGYTFYSGASHVHSVIFGVIPPTPTPTQTPSNTPTRTQTPTTTPTRTQTPTTTPTRTQTPATTTTPTETPTQTQTPTTTTTLTATPTQTSTQTPTTTTTLTATPTNTPTPTNVIQVWSAGGSLSTARYRLAGAGTQNAGLAFGGATPASTSCTEEYNGISWSSGGALITARLSLAGAGTQGAGLAFGGQNGGFPNTVGACTEEYNSGVWSSSNPLITSREALAGVGTQNAGLAFGGAFPYAQNTEEYNGSSWSAGGSLITGRYDLGGAGEQNAALAFGGDYLAVSCTEEYNGSSWSTGGALITARFRLAGAGTQNAGLAFGGYTQFPDGTRASTEEYNGTSWSTGGDLITARSFLAGSGTQTAGLAIGGVSSSAIVSCTEEYS